MSPITLLSRIYRRRNGARTALRERIRDDAGFTLIELGVATTVMATALALLANVLTGGLAATGLARERQSANGLANQTIEQIRALPMTTLAAGMGSNDLAATTDSAISKSKNSTCTGSGTGYCFNGESIKYTTYTTDPSGTTPLVPHTATVAIGKTQFTVNAYLTYFNNDQTKAAYRATVIVSWTSAVQNGQPKSVQAQTVMYAPAIPGTGCLDPSAHPFPGPCQAGFTGDAVQTPASVNITGTIGSTTLDHASLSSARATSNLSVEQVSNIKGTAQGPTAELQAPGASVLVAGGATSTSNAGTYAPGTVGPYETNNFSDGATATQSLTADANGNQISVVTNAGSSGRTTSALLASSPLANCPNLGSYPSPYTANENDGLPCGGSYVTAAATSSAQTVLQTVGATTLANVVGANNTTTTITDRNNAPASGRCASTSGDGCVRAQVTRNAPELSAGGLPANVTSPLKLLNGGYFVKISSLNDSVSAEAGIGSAAPAATQTGMQMTYWTNVGGVAALATATIGALAGTVNIAPITILDPVLGGGTSITLSASVTPRTTSTTSSCSGTCDRTSATATSTPPVVTVTYTVTVAGTTILNTEMILDPGPINASVSYAPPAS